MIHPQSLVHSLVEFKDHSLKAQLGKPTMQVPIQLAFTYPERIFNADITAMTFSDFNRLTFFKPDLKKFPCLSLAYAAGRAGGIMPAVLNAANEEAVSWFLAGRIKYLDIARVVSQVLEKEENIANPDLETILKVDKVVRKKTKLILKKLK
jgi:1-deoxy-D-xylulose-5-phosphate reductoisomerase